MSSFCSVRIDIKLLLLFAFDCRVLVHVVNEVHAVDKTDILQSYVKVRHIVLCILTSLKLSLSGWFSTSTHC